MDKAIPVKQIAEILGVSQRTVYELMHRKEIPYTQVAGRKLVMKRNLERWIERNTIKTKGV